MILSKINEMIVRCLLKDVEDMDSELKQYIVTEEQVECLVRYVDEKYLKLSCGRTWDTLASPFGDSAKGDCCYSPQTGLYSDDLLFVKEAQRALTSEEIREICGTVKEFCAMQYSKKGFLAGLMDLLEHRTSFVSIDGGKRTLFETAKLRAGIVTCIYQCLEEGGVTDYKEYLHRKETEDAFIVSCSLDFLGIKDFKFQKAFAGSLKDVTAASFYIDLFRENVLDDFLDVLNLTRCNLIFSGGRHLHLFLPNVKNINHIVEEQVKRINEWLLEEYQLDLYVSYGIAKVPVLNCWKDTEQRFYLDVFTQIANQKAIVESRKYAGSGIFKMNDILKNRNKMEHEEKIRKRMQVIAEEFGAADYFVISSEKGIPIGPQRFVYGANDLANTHNAVRIYRAKQEKESLYKGTGREVIGIWHEDIQAPELLLKGEKEDRYGLLRMDIDNFRTYMLKNECGSRMTHPAEKMELSKQFSFFLRRDMKRLLKKMKQEWTGRNQTLQVIHEGADDMFLFGEMELLVHFACQMHRYYHSFTSGAVTFCAGFSLYNFKESLAVNAQLAQNLMDQAKTLDGKDGVVLKDEGIRYKWEDLIRNVSYILHSI